MVIVPSVLTGVFTTLTSNTGLSSYATTKDPVLCPLTLYSLHHASGIPCSDVDYAIDANTGLLSINGDNDSITSHLLKIKVYNQVDS